MQNLSAVYVLDSWAMIAYLLGEQAGKPVAELLEKATSSGRSLHMTEIHYAEVKYTIIRRSGPAVWEEIHGLLSVLPVEFHAADRKLADSAGEYKATHKMSLADAFAVALAKEKKAVLVTGDPEFKAVEKEIKVHWLK